MDLCDYVIAWFLFYAQDPLMHPTGSTHSSDWSVNTLQEELSLLTGLGIFLMIVYKKFQSEFSVQMTNEFFFHRRPLLIHLRTSHK